jgi:hypothetical protein
MHYIKSRRTEKHKISSRLNYLTPENIISQKKAKQNAPLSLIILMSAKA